MATIQEEISALEKAINELDEKTKEKAIKEARKNKATDKTDKSIF